MVWVERQKAGEWCLLAFSFLRAVMPSCRLPFCLLCTHGRAVVSEVCSSGAQLGSLREVEIFHIGKKMPSVFVFFSSLGDELWNQRLEPECRLLPAHPSKKKENKTKTSLTLHEHFSLGQKSRTFAIQLEKMGALSSSVSFFSFVSLNWVKTFFGRHFSLTIGSQKFLSHFPFWMGHTGRSWEAFRIRAAVGSFWCILDRTVLEEVLEWRP